MNMYFASEEFKQLVREHNMRQEKLKQRWAKIDNLPYEEQRVIRQPSLDRGYKIIKMCGDRALLTGIAIMRGTLIEVNLSDIDFTPPYFAVLNI